MDVRAERVIAREIEHLDILDMDVRTGRDVDGGDADQGIISPDLFAFCERPPSDLMAGGDIVQCDKSVAQEFAPRDRPQCDQDVVGGVQ
jgi:hypothetical protein